MNPTSFTLRPSSFFIFSGGGGSLSVSYSQVIRLEKVNVSVFLESTPSKLSSMPIVECPDGPSSFLMTTCPFSLFFASFAVSWAPDIGNIHGLKIIKTRLQNTILGYVVFNQSPSCGRLGNNLFWLSRKNKWYRMWEWLPAAIVDFAAGSRSHRKFI